MKQLIALFALFFAYTQSSFAALTQPRVQQEPGSGSSASSGE